MWELIRACAWLLGERLGYPWCLYVHLWPWRNLWVVVINTHTGLKVIICRKCGRQWSLRPLKGWE